MELKPGKTYFAYHWHSLWHIIEADEDGDNVRAKLLWARMFNTMVPGDTAWIPRIAIGWSEYKPLPRPMPLE